MKKGLLLLWTIVSLSAIGQIPAYYSSIDFTLTGSALKNDIGNLITATHTSPTSYPEVWDVLKSSDLDPTNSSVVLLVYGYNDADASIINDRTRNKNNNGGDVGEWNREHVFPKSLGTPALGTSGPGSDPHNLRASDVQANGNRSNRKFASGSGNAGSAGPNWYPGDEWKGDVARIVMYMYLRYGNRCLPKAVTVGTTNGLDANMVNLLLNWNAEDEVSTFEINRNNVIYGEIGNRNPFIDNPRIANLIWGGTIAEDTWGVLSTTENEPLADLIVYPNPTTNNVVYISSTSLQNVDFISIVNLQGKEVFKIDLSTNQSIYKIALGDLPKGIFLMQISTDKAIKVKRIVLQ